MANAKPCGNNADRPACRQAGNERGIEAKFHDPLNNYDAQAAIKASGRGHSHTPRRYPKCLFERPHP